MAETIHAEKMGEYATGLAEKFSSASLLPSMQNCVPLLTESVEANFVALSGSPVSGPWPARKPDPNDDGHALLILTGALIAAATNEPEGSPGAVERIAERSLDIGVDADVIVYAAVHNYGYPEKNIPKREYMAVSNEALDACEDLIAGEVMGWF